MKLRGSLVVCLIVALLLGMVTPVGVGRAATREVRVSLNGKQINFPDQKPVLDSGRTYVPVRFISEAIGADVTWDEATKSVIIVHRDNTVVLPLGMTQVMVDGKSVPLDAPAKLIAGRTMVPLRFVSEILGAAVQWSDVDYAVYITAAGPKTGAEEQLSSANKIGNTPGNINNRGLVARQDEWLYYSGHGSTSMLMKSRTDGTERTQLSDDGSTSFINVVGEWVYYQNNSDGSRLYKIRTDGTDRTPLNNDSSSGITVVGDWVYYTNGSGDKCLYRVKTDGSSRTRLTEVPVGTFSVDGLWIYYQNLQEMAGSNPLFPDRLGHIYKIRTDGTNNTVVLAERAQFIVVADSWIYYSNIEDGTRLYKIRTDGTGQAKLCDDAVFWINVSEGWVYYSNQNGAHAGGTGSRLYRIRTDGSDRTKLTDEIALCVHVIDEWVYYIGSKALMKVRIDGTDRQLVE